MSLAPRAVIVHRRTELDELTERHSTRGQVEFMLATRGRSIAAVQMAHDVNEDSVQQVAVSIPDGWRRADVERDDLDRFLFGPDDVVVVVGRDGLVANVAKYLDGQPLLGINDNPGANAGVLAGHPPADAQRLMQAASDGTAAIIERVMVEARLDDDQVMTALNDVYVGDAGHQSARYTLTAPNAPPEVQSSSGIIVGTGTGSTGWLSSLNHDRGTVLPLPDPTDPLLAWYVREAWPSPFTSAEQIHGLLVADDRLAVTVQSEALVVFGDGIEHDRLTAAYGQTVSIGLSPKRLRQVE